MRPENRNAVCDIILSFPFSKNNSVNTHQLTEITALGQPYARKNCEKLRKSFAKTRHWGLPGLGAFSYKSVRNVLPACAGKPDI
jgi:hypothetical protein